MTPTLRTRLIAAALLLWTLGAGLFLAHHDSMTTDEGVHIASGYLAITRHDMRFDPEHPFLFKMASALPIVAIHPNPPKDDQLLWNAAEPTYYDSWRESRQWAEEWFYTSGNNADLMIFLARVPAVLLLTLTVWLVYRLSKLWFKNDTVALWAMAITAFNPMLLAHGHLANTDAPLAPVFLISIYALWRYGEKPTLKNALWFALACAVTMLTKYTGLILVPIFIIFLAVLAKRQTITRKQFWGHVFAAALLVYIGIWAGYFFSSVYHPATATTGPLSMVGQFMDKHHLPMDGIATTVAHIMPAEYAKGLVLQAGNLGLGRVTYLLSSFHPSGVWYYFPVLYILKTPVVDLVLLGLAAWLMWKSKKKESVHLALGVAILVYALVAILNKLNIGLRHILPMFPILSMYMALAAPVAVAWFKNRTMASAVLAVLCVSPTLLSFPYFINYSNIFVQPSAHAFAYFNDSNLDWGQDAKEIVYVANAKFPGETVYANYKWSPNVLGYYGLKATEFDPKNPPHDGVILVTANEMTDSPYAQLRAMTPVATISNTAFFYQVR